MLLDNNQMILSRTCFPGDRRCRGRVSLSVCLSGSSEGGRRGRERWRRVGELAVDNNVV